MKPRISTLVSFSLCILAIYCQVIPAQDFDWKKIAPGGEEYTVEMPGQPTRVGRVIPIDGGIKLAPNVYDLVVNNVRYQIMSFNKSSQSSVPMLRDFNAFVEGFQRAFNENNAKTNKSLTFEKNLTNGTQSVQQFQLKVDDYSGLLRLYEAKNHFYAVIIIGGGEADAIVSRFLNSFKLGERHEYRLPDKTAGNAQQPESPPELWSGGLPANMAPISAGILNGKATDLPIPKYPNEAKGTGASGVVKVRVLVDEQGKVISAEAIEGPSVLLEAATKAALKARFSQTRLMGQPVKVSGILVYRFVDGR